MLADWRSDCMIDSAVSRVGYAHTPTVQSLHAGAHTHVASLCACCDFLYCTAATIEKKKAAMITPPSQLTVRHTHPQKWRHCSDIARHVEAVSLLLCASTKARARLRDHGATTRRPRTLH
ncbi:hypothetical protein IG631_05023 [Alternaria alternata]|nr:hypothetical protein IG631_05023 [Alternaria alternata]